MTPFFQRNHIIPAMFLMAGMFFYSCKNDIKEVKELMDSENFPVQTTYDSEITYSDSGIVTIRLTSEQMDRYMDYMDKESYIEFPKGMKVVFFDDPGEESARLTANHAILYEKSNKMVARDDVVFINEKGEKLNTEKLTWSQDSGKVYTNEFVKITRENGVIHGNGLVAEEDFSQYEIKEITGEFYFEEEALGPNKDTVNGKDK